LATDWPAAVSPIRGFAPSAGGLVRIRFGPLDGYAGRYVADRRGDRGNVLVALLGRQVAAHALVAG
jgi:hypothetical protein